MIELIGVAVGAKLKVVGGITAEVMEAIDDEWVRVRLVSVPDGRGTVGTEELCHATDVQEILPA
jgi:hypothetical protein